MNKSDKRQFNLRNKLFAAIAMLLVSSIMMVSTTYAWFTLSTAPEVQGITTTVGANGNLEIALSPADGLDSGIGSAMGDSNKEWTVKNLTWGNLINLSDESYGLGGITLLPSRLNVSAVATTPLQTPVYGSDGRVDKLEANTSLGKLVMEGETATYQVDTAHRGVRAIGTSSSMTKYQITFNNYLASMGQRASSAQDLAEISLKNNGSKLAEMAIAHATAEGTDTTDYTEYEMAMQAVVENLVDANEQIYNAIRDALITIAASNYTGNAEATYDAFMLLVDSGNTLEQLMESAGITFGDDGRASSADANLANIVNFYNQWLDIDADLTAADDAVQDLDTDDNGKISWEEASVVLNDLMNTTGITLNNYGLSEFKVQAKRYVSAPESTDTFPNDTYTATDYDGAMEQYDAASDFMAPFFSGGVEMGLGTGSGIYADMAVLVGNLNVSVNVDIIVTSPLSLNLKDFPITIKTTTASAEGGQIGQARIALATVGAYQPTGESTATGVLNETYGYIVDFMFRTNASNSSLLLQTDPAQRIYSDGNSDATLGNGSSMTFRTGNIDGNAVQNLMECIRVVFLDTESGGILGIAALDMTNATQTVVSEATETAAAVIDITAKLYLCDGYTENQTTGVLELGEMKTDKATAVLCDLAANTAKAVSAMVYLDGDSVTNADVANAATSTTGTLNLQFASSAPLDPMDNEALKNMAAEETTAATTAEETTAAATAEETTEATTAPEG